MVVIQRGSDSNLIITTRQNMEGALQSTLAGSLINQEMGLIQNKFIINEPFKRGINNG